MLTMNFTYRIYPDEVQQQLMQSWLETCRFVYNRALRELKDWIASRKSPIDRCPLDKEYIIPANAPFPSYHRQQNDLPKLKQEYPHLAQVHSQILQTTIRRLHDTWDAFQERGFGFPRFRKFGQFRSFVFPQFKANPITNHPSGSQSLMGGTTPLSPTRRTLPSTRGTRTREMSLETRARRWLPKTALSHHIKLPKIGAIQINLHRPIPEGFVVKQVRVLSRCRNTQWYVVVTLQSQVSVPSIPVHGRAIGIDLGLERFLITSDNFTVERPKFLKSQHRKLKLLQRSCARKQKRSQNWEKAQVKVARLHHRIGNTRKDFHLKTCHLLCNQAQTIFAEDLNTVGLNRGMLRHECADASFGAFLSLLEWVCFKRGCYFQRVNPRGTSQTCPECGATVAKPLSEREHICPECQYRTHRDHAAGQMVLLRGMNSVVPMDSGERKQPVADELAGNESSSQVSKTRKEVTRKASRRLEEARTITRSV